MSNKIVKAYKNSNRKTPISNCSIDDANNEKPYSLVF